MDFGPFGLSEVLFIGFLALVLFGPQGLPKLARSAAGIIAALRRGTEDLRQTFQKELDQVDEATGGIRTAANDLRSVGETLRSTSREIVRHGSRLVTSAAPPRRSVPGAAEPVPEPQAEGGEEGDAEGPAVPPGGESGA